MRATARYTTPKGIGYDGGYTTLEGFFSTNPCSHDSWLPFLDLRGHVFDNGKLAANAGFGLRYLSKSRVWGMNAYYDYRSTKRQNYNQASAGLESLGRVWDFRINGYLPVGRKQSPYSHAKFHSFTGHSFLIERKKDFAMKGTNAEAGYHLDHFRSAPLYFAAGPYYLTGKGKTTWGGQLRATVEFFHGYLKLEGNTSYDHFFKWIGQGQVSVNIPFGKRCEVSNKERCTEDRLFTRAIQRVDRYEIIPVGKQKTVAAAIDPATGQPWVFWVVNNTSHSLGTFEDPFPTLLEAQNASSANQVIYVFPGDGTVNGMSNGIVLKDSQQFLGASLAYSFPTTKGTVIIPAMASTSPSITNTAGDVVTLGNNNAVSGFNITTTFDSSNGIFGNGISNLVARNNTFITPTTITTNGITLNSCFGQILVENSVFDGFTCNDSSNNGNGIYCVSGALETLSITGNSFNNISNPSLANGGSALFLNSSTINTVSSLSNTFNNFNNSSAGIFTQGGAITTFNFSDNTLNNINNSSSGIFTLGSAITTFNFSGNTINNLSNGSSGIFTDGGTITTFNFSDNTFNNLNNGSSGFNASSGTITTLSSSGNTCSGLIESFGFNIASPVTTFSSIGDTFTGLNQSEGIFYVLTSGNGNVSISGDTFIADTDFANLVDGFAADIELSVTDPGGTLCLEFVNNTATVTTGAIHAYLFERFAGTFNSTSNSSTSTNIGSFSIGSGVSFPGTCTISP